MNGKIGFVAAVAIVVAFAAAGVYAGCPTCSLASADDGKKASAEKVDTEVKAKPQTICPVMGGKIDKGTYVDVEGKRVYACCPGCLAKIKADPKKYIEKIKQKGEEPEDAFPEISAKELLELINSKKDVIILDARTGKWDDGRRIPGAKSLSSSATAEEVEKIAGKDKDALIVTYCANLKCPASRNLAHYLRKLKYTDVTEYPEGIEGWAAAGYKVDKVTKSK